MGSGGAGGLRGDNTTRDEDIHNNQIDHAEGGVVGDDDDDDDDDYDTTTTTTATTTTTTTTMADAVGMMATG